MALFSKSFLLRYSQELLREDLFMVISKMSMADAVGFFLPLRTSTFGHAIGNERDRDEIFI